MTVIATIEPSALVVDPGGTAEAKVRVRNQSDRVDGFRLEIVGPVGAWTEVEPAVLQLFPRTEGEATIRFRPPRAAAPRAGRHPFGVRIRSVADPESVIVEEGDVGVTPFVELKSDLIARVARGWRRAGHVVSVRNAGNSTAHVNLAAVDPEEELTLSIAPASADIPSDAAIEVRTTATPRALLLGGPRRRWPYSIHVTERTAGTQSLSAIFEQWPLAPGWLRPAAGLVLAAVLAVAFGPRIIDWVTGRSTETSAPSLVASSIGPTPSVAPTALTSPSPAASPSADPTEAPPTPTAMPTSSTMPSPTPAVPFVAIQGHPRLDGTYVAAQSATLESSSMYFSLEFSRPPAQRCSVFIEIRDVLEVRTYDFATEVFGQWSCAGDLTYTGAGGVLDVKDLNVGVTASFWFYSESGAESGGIVSGQVVQVPI